MNVLLTEEQRVNAANHDALYSVMLSIIERDQLLELNLEQMWVIGLNEDYRIHYIERVAIGAVDILTIPAKDALSLAVQFKCPKIIIARSAIMDELELMEHDTVFLLRQRKAAELLGITLLHKIIFNTEGYKVLH